MSAEQDPKPCEREHYIHPRLGRIHRTFEALLGLEYDPCPPRSES